MSSDHSGGNGLNGSNNFIFAAGNDPVWHCSPASTNLTYSGVACSG